jgi:tetratricopeptide (TPR) repeat protein
MKSLGRLVSAAILGMLPAATPLRAQFPDKFTNLKVLPKDISKNQLQATMRGFAFALGVRCEHCHVQNSDKSMDFANDQKAAKATARLMLEMVAAVNREYIAKVKDPNHTPFQVECVTCHHGLTQPRQLKNVLADDLAQHGAPHALALYDELRGRYDSTGAYDFGEATLNQLTESLLAQNKNREALAFMEKNFSANHPDSVWSFHMLAMTHQATDQPDKALADYRKVLELHPDDTWAAKQIEVLSAPKP